MEPTAVALLYGPSSYADAYLLLWFTPKEVEKIEKHWAIHSGLADSLADLEVSLWRSVPALVPDWRQTTALLEEVDLVALHAGNFIVMEHNWWASTPASRVAVALHAADIGFRFSAPSMTHFTRTLSRAQWEDFKKELEEQWNQ